ncbi:MAG: hypothetical protein V2I97_17790 [Desulfococcaceae bacterium]|jgi:hypothetical protein|nr:hypothetical protein [Desulfococcaceae bacterium]
MTENQFKTLIERFRPGDYVDTGQGDYGIGKIIDIFSSEHSGSFFIIFRFIRNIGREPYWGGDGLLVSKERTIGIENWKKIHRKDIQGILEQKRREITESVDVF